MRATFLTGERVYLRAMIAADKETATAWFPGPFPVNAVSAEEWLKEVHKDGWEKTRWYVIVRVADDAIIGSVQLQDRHQRRGMATFHMAPLLPEADTLRAEVLRLIVPWVRDDLEWMVFTLMCAADETETIAAARDLGMEETVRLREFVARAGTRVDRLYLQVLNKPWRAEEERTHA